MLGILLQLILYVTFGCPALPTELRHPPLNPPGAALTFLALATELDDGFVQGQVAVDVSCCLLVILAPQGRLHAVHAELQVQDVVGSLDGLVEAVL